MSYRPLSLRRRPAVFCLLAIASIQTVIAAEQATPASQQSESAGQVADLGEPPRRKSGYHLDGFRIRPALTVGVEYDDNVFTTRSNTESDRIVTLSPQVKIDSVWASHSLGFKAGVDAGLHDRWSDENYVDRWASMDGRFDLSETSQLYVGVGYEFGHEGRDSPDANAGAVEPTTFHALRANAGSKTVIDGIQVQFGVTFETLDFENVPSRTGVIINSDRNRAMAGVGLRIAKRIGDATEVFAHALAEQRDYERKVDQFGFRRDSDGYRLAAGFKYRVSEGNEIEAYLGSLRREYEDKRFGVVDKPDIGGKASWVPVAHSRLTLEVQRSVNDTTEIGSAGYIKTAFSAGLELGRDLRLSPYLNAGYSDSDFLTTGRQDQDYFVAAGIKYFVTRNGYITFGARHSRRDSNDAGATVVSNDFRKNVVFVNFTAQLYPLNP